MEHLDKESAELRIVFDSAAPYMCLCLNDALEKGLDYERVHNNVTLLKTLWKSKKECYRINSSCTVQLEDILFFL